jgi:hypothetical protein
VIRHVLTLPAERLAQVRASATRRVLTERVWPIQILRSLEAVVPHVAAIADDVRRELINTPWAGGK